VSEDKISLKIAYALVATIIILVVAVIGLAASLISINNNGSYFNAYVLAHGYSNAQYNDLQNQLNDLNDTVNLKKEVYWLNNQTITNAAGEVVQLKPTTPVSYVGYILLEVFSLTGNNSTAIEVTYSSSNYNVKMDTRTVVGVSYTTAFAVLPTTNLVVSIEILDGSAASENVTIVYYY
jgi:hypothetical protein